MLQSLTFYLHPSPSSRPLSHLSSVRVGMKATDGTSGVRGYTLWDKGEEKSLKRKRKGKYLTTTRRELKSLSRVEICSEKFETRPGW